MRRHTQLGDLCVDPVGLPMLFGVGILFWNGRSSIGWFLTAAAALFILGGVIANMHIFFQPASLFEMRPGSSRGSGSGHEARSGMMYSGRYHQTDSSYHRVCIRRLLYFLSGLSCSRVAIIESIPSPTLSPRLSRSTEYPAPDARNPKQNFPGLSPSGPFARRMLFHSRRSSKDVLRVWFRFHAARRKPEYEFVLRIPGTCRQRCAGSGSRLREQRGAQVRRRRQLPGTAPLWSRSLNDPRP